MAAVDQCPNTLDNPEPPITADSVLHPAIMGRDREGPAGPVALLGHSQRAPTPTPLAQADPSFCRTLHFKCWVPFAGICHAVAGQSLRGKKLPKLFQNCSFAKTPPVAHMFNHGWWRLVAGGWRLVAVGGGWWSAIGGWWGLVVGGWWRLVVPGGGP